MQTLRFTLCALLVIFALALSGATPAGAPEPVVNGGHQVGTVYAYRVATPRFLPASWSTMLVSPGATFLRIHFAGVRLAKGDTLTVSSPDRSQVWTYTDRGPNGNGDLWSFAIDGEQAIVQVHNKSGQSRGFRILEIGHGTVDLDSPSIQVVCGTEGREGIACHTNDPIINATQRPVARLLYTSGGSQYLCTGQLVDGANPNTLITNNHCLSTQTEVSTLEARFNYQYTTCGGGTLGSTTSYAGGTLLKTNPVRYSKRTPNSGLDYTLLTLQGNPETTWGELTPSTQAATVGQQINFIQHGGGNPKQIGYWEDAAHTIRCKVDTINQTYGTSLPNSQVGYGCDSEGGSSGSAITDAGTGHIIALHHYGGVSSTPCLNSGSAMTIICADAGALLNCVSD